MVVRCHPSISLTRRFQEDETYKLWHQATRNGFVLFALKSNKRAPCHCHNAGAENYRVTTDANFTGMLVQEQTKAILVSPLLGEVNTFLGKYVMHGHGMQGLASTRLPSAKSALAGTRRRRRGVRLPLCVYFPFSPHSIPLRSHPGSSGRRAALTAAAAAAASSPSVSRLGTMRPACLKQFCALNVRLTEHI